MPYKYKKDIKNKEKIKKYNKQWYLKNKEYKKNKDKIWQQNNKEKVKELRKQWYLKNREKKLKSNKLWSKNNKEKHKQLLKEWFQKNKDFIREKNKKRRYTDPLYKISCILRGRLSNALRNNIRSKSTLKLLGCSVKELWIHLEKSFKPGMTRENHGKWHIDHIKPCSSFDLTKPSEQRECFHYTNLQPLWASENLSKGNRIS